MDCWLQGARQDGLLVARSAPGGIVGCKEGSMRDCWLPHKLPRKQCRGYDRVGRAGRVDHEDRRAEAKEARPARRMVLASLLKAKLLHRCL
jgi:hypothetical protein